MATDKLKDDKYWNELPKTEVKETLGERKPLAGTDILLEKEPLAEKSAGPDILGKLLEERRKHREKLLKFIMWLTIASFTLLSLIVLVQIGTRLYLQNPQKPFSVFDGHELKFLISGVFGQIIGLIAIIVNSLWNDKNYLDNLTK